MLSMPPSSNVVGFACLLLLLLFGCSETNQGQEAGRLQAWRQKRAEQAQAGGGGEVEKEWEVGRERGGLAATAREDEKLGSLCQNGKDISDGDCVAEYCNVDIQNPMDVYYEFGELRSLLATVSCSFGDPNGAVARVQVNGKALAAALH
eukprot:1099979-Rhodomonas_salina.1